MLTANLLPAEEKNYIQDGARARIIFFLASSAAVIFVIGAILLLPSYLPLLWSVQAAREELKIEEQATEDFHVQETVRRIKSTKALISSLQSFFDTRQNTSSLLENLLSRAQGITVLSLTIDKEGMLSLRGRAKTRKELLDFEHELQGSGMLEELSLPLSQIIRETDISFSLDGKLKLNKRISP